MSKHLCNTCSNCYQAGVRKTEVQVHTESGQKTGSTHTVIEPNLSCFQKNISLNNLKISSCSSYNKLATFRELTQLNISINN